MQAVEPYYVRFHDGGSYYPFLVTHEGEPGDTGPEGDELSDEEATALRSGWVFAAESSKGEAGLSDGLNRRDKIGHGGPGYNVSWSAYGEATPVA